MEPEPERRRAKLASRREAKDEEGRFGSTAAMLYLISAAVGDAALPASAFREEAAGFKVSDDDDDAIGTAEREPSEMGDTEGGRVADGW